MVSATPSPSWSRNREMRLALGTSAPAWLWNRSMKKPRMQNPSSGLGGALLSATSTSPLGSTCSQRGWSSPPANSLTAKPWAAVGIVPVRPWRRLGDVDRRQPGRIGLGERRIRSIGLFDRNRRLLPREEDTRRLPAIDDDDDEDEKDSQKFPHEMFPPALEMANAVKAFRLRRAARHLREIGGESGDILVREVLRGIAHQMLVARAAAFLRPEELQLALRYIRRAGRTSSG